MPQHISLEDYVQIAADGYSNLQEEIAGAAVSAYCAIAYDNPFAVFWNNNVTSPIIKRTLDKICSQPTPEPEPPPFSGGQCEGIRYRVGFEWRYGTNPMAEGYRDVYGVVEGIGVEEYQGGWRVCIYAGNAQGAQGVCYSLNFNPIPTNNYNSEAITSVTPLDGAVDDCGDPEGGGYPDQPPPDVSITNTTVSITNTQGDTNEYSVTINNDITGYVRFPPIINVSGVSVGIDATGIEIGEFNITKNSGGGGSGSDINLTGDGAGGSDVATEESDPIETEEGYEKTVDNLIAIKIDITSIPSNASISSGHGAARVIYPGWVIFKNGEYHYERKYINFDKNYFEAPAQSDGYAVTIKPGYIAAVTEVVEAQTEE